MIWVLAILKLPMLCWRYAQYFPTEATLNSSTIYFQISNSSTMCLRIKTKSSSKYYNYGVLLFGCESLIDCKFRPLKQIKSITAKHLDEREYTDLKITRTDISIILWFDGKLVPCKVGKLFLRWMSSNYKTAKGFIESEYSHWLAIGSELINLEMLDIYTQKEYNEAELKFYKKLIEMIRPFKDSKVLMIVPIKHNIPNVQSRICFDFEANILDFRH